MKIRTMAWITGSAFVVAFAGLGAAACSSDNGSGTGLPAVGADGSTTNNDATTPAKDGAPSTMDGTVSPGTDSGDAGTTGSDCGATAILHATDGSTGAYCSHQADAAAKYCGAGQTCCAPKFPQDQAPQTCIAQGTPCTFAIDGGDTIECESDVECLGGKLCCVQAAFGQDPGCSNYYGSKVNGAFCKTACAAGELHACQTQAECATSGGTCTPFRAAGRDYGACKM